MINGLRMKNKWNGFENGIEREVRGMTRDEALNTLIAHGCCNSGFSMCAKCPWKFTDDCKNTSFSDVIEEAVNIMLEETENEENENGRHQD